MSRYTDEVRDLIMVSLDAILFHREDPPDPPPVPDNTSVLHVRSDNNTHFTITIVETGDTV